MSHPDRPEPADEASLARLGSGGAGDRLGFRLVVALLWRCIGLLRPVRSHVAVMALGWLLLAALILPLGFLLFDLFWTRALQGQPLTEAGAAALGLEPARAVQVEMLDPELRRHVARVSVLLALLVVVVGTPLGMGLWYYQVWILQRVNQLLRSQLFQRFQALSLRFHSDSSVGDAIYRLYQDSAMVTQLIDVLFLTPTFSLARFAFTVLLVSAFDPWLALVVLAVWPPALLLGAVFSRRLRAGFRRARESNSALTARIQETLAGIRVIKAYGAEGREQARFETDSRAAFAAAFDARSRLAVFGVLLFWLAGGMLLLSSGWAAWATAEKAPLYVGAALATAGLSHWNLGLYNAFKSQVGSGATGQLRRLFDTWGRTQDIAIGLDRVFELLDLEPEVQDRPDAVDLPPVQRGIAFRELCFGYRQRPVLEKVDFEAPVGAITAVVGPTGAGKSTLMALLLRLFEPDSGQIEIDGRGLSQFRLASLRARIGIALQENMLFGTTVRENIRYAVPEASDEAVREAARVACAADFIEALPQGYDTPLGERGAKLSSGQRQRLSIARAVLKQPDVLILDEPTASLDAETELAVLSRLAEWGRERVVLLVTHRLSTIRSADQIIVLGEGRVAEQGSHEALMQLRGGAYRRLVERESAGLREAEA